MFKEHTKHQLYHYFSLLSRLEIVGAEKARI